MHSAVQSDVTGERLLQDGTQDLAKHLYSPELAITFFDLFFVPLFRAFLLIHPFARPISLCRCF